VALLNRGDLNRDWHFARMREVQAAPDGHLDLWAREHGKTLGSKVSEGWTLGSETSETRHIFSIS